MPWGVAAAVVGGVASAALSGSASSSASNAQASSDQAAIAEQDKQFNVVKDLMQPYNTAGTGALSAQQDLLGLNGNTAQSGAINTIKNGSEYQDLQAQGNNAILQNASATGGLRGGNTEGALAQFSPQLLQSLIQQQYGNLAGMSAQGENAAGMVGNAAQTTGNNVSSLLQAQGNAKANGIIGQANAYNKMIGSVTQGVGMYQGGF